MLHAILELELESFLNSRLAHLEDIFTEDCYG